VALVFGLIITVMVASTGHLSGAHFNPAVTLAFAVIRHFPLREVPVYVGSQLAGAAAGALTLQVMFGPVANLGATVPSGSAWQAVGIEILLTAVLMFVITSVATDTRAVGEMAAIAIGATVALDALWAGPITGASMNPARSFGPALVSGEWHDHWVYWVGPSMGAMLGAGVYRLLRSG
jgi:MIP family channel proteins